MRHTKKERQDAWSEHAEFESYNKMNNVTHTRSYANDLVSKARTQYEYVQAALRHQGGV